MKLMLLFMLIASSLCAAPSSVLFKTEFTKDGTVADVSATIVGKDADGFASSKTVKASQLPAQQQAQFGALRAALSAAANQGGWILTGGEMAQTGSTADFVDGKDADGNTSKVAVPGTSRGILTLWMTQTKGGKVRFQTVTSEAWPVPIRNAVLALWEWVKTQ